MATVPQSLGELIRRQRELAALPMRQLAAMSGISGPYLSQIENGLRAPSDQVIRNLAAAMGIDPEDLLGADPEADPAALARDAMHELIKADPNLSTAQRRALTEVYDAFAASRESG